MTTLFFFFPEMSAASAPTPSFTGRRISLRLGLRLGVGPIYEPPGTRA